MIKTLFNDHRETILNVFWRGLQLAVKDGVSFIIFILAAKFLNPYEFGVYNYVLAVIFFLILFGDFGISVAASKYVAEYQATDPEKLKYVLFNSGLVILVLTILVTAATLLLGPGFLQEKYLYVLYILPIIFLAPMTSLYDGIYRGLRKFQQLALLSTGVSLISLGFIYYLIRKYGLIGALLSQNLFYLFLFLILAFCYRDFLFKLNREILKSVGFYALVIGIIHVSAFLYTRVDILVLGSFDLIVEIGYYEIVNKVLMLMQLPFLVYAQVQAPDIVASYCREGSPIILRKTDFIHQICNGRLFTAGCPARLGDALGLALFSDGVLSTRCDQDSIHLPFYIHLSECIEPGRQHVYHLHRSCADQHDQHHRLRNSEPDSGYPSRPPLRIYGNCLCQTPRRNPGECFPDHPLPDCSEEQGAGWELIRHPPPGRFICGAHSAGLEKRST